MPTQNSESLDSSNTSQPWTAIRTFMSTAAKALCTAKSLNPGCRNEWNTDPWEKILSGAPWHRNWSDTTRNRLARGAGRCALPAPRYRHSRAGGNPGGWEEGE